MYLKIFTTTRTRKCANTKLENLQQQQAKLRLYHLGKNRYIANGTITKDNESSISQNVRYEIEKQQYSIEKELKERLNKVNMELYDINNTIQNINDNNINLFIDGDKLMETINESKLLIKKLNKVSNETIKKLLNNSCNYSQKEKIKIDSELIQLAKNNVKKQVYVLTRAQKRKLEEEKQRKKKRSKKRK